VSQWTHFGFSRGSIAIAEGRKEKKRLATEKKRREEKNGDVQAPLSCPCFLAFSNLCNFNSSCIFLSLNLFGSSSSPSNKNPPLEFLSVLRSYSTYVPNMFFSGASEPPCPSAPAKCFVGDLVRRAEEEEEGPATAFCRAEEAVRVEAEEEAAEGAWRVEGAVGEVESAGITTRGRFPSALGCWADWEACWRIFCSRSWSFALAAENGGGRGEEVGGGSGDDEGGTNQQDG
jgi:hypothetical protein